MINYISDLPFEISTRIFFEHLDEKSRLFYSTLDTKIHHFIFSTLLDQLKLPDEEAPYFRVIQHYKAHCAFFITKLPTSFVEIHLGTVTDLKMEIDKKLTLLPQEVKGLKSPFLKEIWTRFLNKIDPVENNSGFAMSMRPKPHEDFNDEIKDHNREIQILLRAGAREARFYRDISGSVIKQKWCTLETAGLLIDYKFKVTMKTLLYAIQSKIFETMLPLFFKVVQLESGSLSQLCKTVSDVHRNLMIKSCEDRICIASNDDIKGLIEEKFPEKFITKMLKKCTDGLDPRLIKKALEDRYSEDLIISLIEKCPYALDIEYVTIAADDGYRSRELIKRLMDNLPKSRLPLCLEELMRRHYYPEIVSHYLSERTELFSLWEFRISNTLERVIALEYPEEVLNQIVDHLEFLQESDVTFAKQKKYSNKLIQKMEFKIK